MNKTPEKAKVNSSKKCKQLYDTIEEGDSITVHTTVEAFYSNYAGNPHLSLEPGVAAIVQRVKRPNVRYSKAYKDVSVVVNFFSPATGREETASVWYQNIDKVIEAGENNESN